MLAPRKFFIVDDNSDSRFLLVKTLVRKFPNATIEETHDGATALELAKNQSLDAIVVHRSAEIDGLSLVRMMRHASPAIPIIMVSGIERTQDALAAGASAFLHYDAWLRIGTVVAEIIQAVPRPPTPGAAAPSTTRAAV